LRDLTGQVVFERTVNFSQDQVLDMDKFKKGVYILELVSEKFLKRLRVMKN